MRLHSSFSLLPLLSETLHRSLSCSSVCLHHLHRIVYLKSLPTRLNHSKRTKEQNNTVQLCPQTTSFPNLLVSSGLGVEQTAQIFFICNVFLKMGSKIAGLVVDAS